eukprot:2535034-Lingulodinium_polyedra.AAC.1
MDQEKNRYVFFDKLVEEMGVSFDPAGAFAKAEQRAARCVELGGHWVNGQATRGELEFMLLERSHAK